MPIDHFTSAFFRRYIVLLESIRLNKYTCWKQVQNSHPQSGKVLLPLCPTSRTKNNRSWKKFSHMIMYTGFLSRVKHMFRYLEETTSSRDKISTSKSSAKRSLRQQNLYRNKRWVWVKCTPKNALGISWKLVPFLSALSEQANENGNGDSRALKKSPSYKYAFNLSIIYSSIAMVLGYMWTTNDISHTNLPNYPGNLPESSHSLSVYLSKWLVQNFRNNKTDFCCNLPWCFCAIINRTEQLSFLYCLLDNSWIWSKIYEMLHFHIDQTNLTVINVDRKAVDHVKDAYQRNSTVPNVVSKLFITYFINILSHSVMTKKKLVCLLNAPYKASQMSP